MKDSTVLLCIAAVWGYAHIIYDSQPDAFDFLIVGIVFGVFVLNQLENVTNHLKTLNNIDARMINLNRSIGD